MDHLESGARIEDLFAGRFEAGHRLPVPFRHVAAGAFALVRAVDHFSAAILHVVDDRAFVLAPPVRKRGIGVDHLRHGRFPRSKSEGIIGLIVPNTDARDRLDDVLHPRVVGDMDGHQVTALLQPPAQRMFTAAATAEVAEALLSKLRALPYAEGLVGHLCRRRHAVVERRGVDEGLDRRAGLAIGLRGAVEAAQAAVEPALHGEDAASLRGFRQEAARHLGHDPQPVTGTRRLRSNDVADLERARGARECIVLAIGQADRRRTACLGDDADTPILIIDAEVRRGELRVQATVLRVQRCNRSREATIAVIAQQLRPESIARRVLELYVQRSAHPQAAGVNAIPAIIGGFAKLRDELAAHLFEEIAGIGRTFAALLDEAKRLRLGSVRLGGGDKVVGDHLVENEIAARHGEIAVALASVTFRRLRQDREERGLMQVQLVDILVEIGARGCLYAEASPPERNFVEIEFENFLLGQNLLDPLRKDHLLELTGDRVFVA